MMEKRRQVEETLLAIAGRCSATPILEFLINLRDMHLFYKLPVWLEDKKSGNVLAGAISRSAVNVTELSVVEANLLANMLLWSEVQDHKDNAPRLAILRVLGEKSSFHAIFATLKQHLEFVSGLYARERLYTKESAGTYRAAAILQEVQITRELILKCGGDSKETLGQSRKSVIAFPAK